VRVPERRLIRERHRRREAAVASAERVALFRATRPSPWVVVPRGKAAWRFTAAHDRLCPIAAARWGVFALDILAASHRK